MKRGLAGHGHCSHELTEAAVTCTRLGPLACMGEGLTRLRPSLSVYRPFMGARVEGVIFFSGEATDKLPRFQSTSTLPPSTHTHTYTCTSSTGFTGFKKKQKQKQRH